MFIGLVGAFGLGPLARQAVSEDIGQAAGWSRRGQRITLASASGAAAVGFCTATLLGLAVEETIAAIAFFGIAGMSASKSIDANILIVAGRTKQFGTANLAAACTICGGIILAYGLGLLTLQFVISINAASLVMQMLYISYHRRKFVRGLVATELRKDTRRILIAKVWRAWKSQLIEAALLRSDSALFIAQGTVALVGYYAVVALVPQVSYQVYQTLIQHSYAKWPALRLRRRTTLLWQLCMLLSLPIAALGAVGGTLLIPVVFGPAFEPAVSLLGPACAMVVCLAGLAPVLQHFAVSPTGDAWFPVAAFGLVVIAWFAGNNFGPAISVLLLAVGFLITGGGYVYLLSGNRMFRVSSSDLMRLFGR
ncbi:hypothetical protein [Pseudarthrobacter phenanthrenivorans]|uniref:hypothetical protein n=1 Tax=Pseudarthrobacter phenanthrenivorans TaxID=361575 RepID=UPI0012E07CE3|nr:hypothetical protein [Pseudarthrobacter phenanthrenivorans]